MLVALVCPYSFDAPGGVATHVLGLAAWLSGQGQRVTVIAPGTEPRPVADGVELHLLGRARNFRFNGSVAQLAVGRSQSAEALRIALTADVVHVHEPMTPGVAFAVARSVGALVVTHHASFDVPSPVAWALRRRSSSLGPRQSIAVSRAAAATARRTCGVEPVIIGNGLILPDSPAPRAGWRGGDRPRIGFLGRLDETRKGFGTFRQLADLAASTGLDAEFVAIGPGHVDPGRVKLWGAVDDATRDQKLQDVDVLVAPSLFGESFGLVLVEALSAGCEVVASDLPGFRDVLATADVGTHFPVGDVEAGLAALRTTLRNPTDSAVLYAAASHWSWDSLGPRVLAQYSAALTGAGTNSEPQSAMGDALGWGA